MDIISSSRTKARYRCGQEEDYDVKSMVRVHGEPFRPGVQSSSLEEWESRMRALELL